jgi:predicted acylesterase/phospholipase RssA
MVQMSRMNSTVILCACAAYSKHLNILPCGHVLCTACVKLYGSDHGDNELDLYHCPLESSAMFSKWSVRLKPKNAGVRVLTLDGGGVRGIVELQVLQALQAAIGVNIDIQKFFDLIVGTSTGGLITLGLGVMNWKVDECIEQFESMVKEAFTRRTGGSIWGIGLIVDNFNHSQYETRPLESCLKEAFTNRRYLFGGRTHSDGSASTSAVKIAVTATSASGRSAFVLGNYNRVCSSRLLYQFLRPEKRAMELKIWEAARATSAAPTYFKPFVHEPTHRSFIDGAVHHNNPIEVAERERKLIWPDCEDDFPDLVVSLGTATSPELKREQSTHITRRGLINHGRAMVRVAKNLVDATIECDNIWDKFLTGLPLSARQSRFIRINPELHIALPALDHVGAIPVLREAVRLYLHDSTIIKRLASQLIATCFYFELTGQITEIEPGLYTAEGDDP